MIDRYKILITGKNTDYFLHKLINNKINIYNLNKTQKGLLVVVSKQDYEKIISIKTTYKISIVNRYGIARIKYLFNKYLIFLICLVLGIILITILSKMIFSIKVIHSNKEIRDIIINDLREKGIEKFHFKVSYKEKEKIKEYILNKETNDIEWLEIEESGTKYIVRVEQRKKNKKEDVCIPRNIIAKKNAMILNIDSSIGEIVKKKLDYVKKGEVIISGLIHNKETIVSKRCATGKVFGEVWYKISMTLPKYYREESTTGKTKTEVNLKLFNKTYSLSSNFKTYKKEVTPIIKSNIIPFNINITKYLETSVKEEYYTLKNVDKKAISLATKKLKNKLSEEDSIISKNVLKKYEKNSKIIVDIFFKVRENITDTESIEGINIEDENNKNKEE